MRRLIKHGMAGAGFAALTMAAAVATLGSPAGAGTALAVPAPFVSAASIATSSPSGTDSALTSEAAARNLRETRDAARAELTAATRQQAVKRASTLGQQGNSIAAQQRKITNDQARAAAKVKAAAEQRAAKAEAAKAKVAAAAAARTKAEKAAAIKAEAKAQADAAAAASAADARREAADARREAADARREAANDRGYDSNTTNPRDIAKEILANKFGYGPEQYTCFNYIIMRESMWDVNATNKSSGAYGIPQALPGSKMASAGADWRTNPATQITWAIGYMDDRYGSPCEAKVFKAANGWY